MRHAINYAVKRGSIDYMNKSLMIFSIFVALLNAVQVTAMQTSTRTAVRDSVRTVSHRTDSSKIVSPLQIDAPSETTAPGEYPFSTEQDKFFFKARSLPVSPSARFRFDATQVSKNEIFSPHRERTVVEQARENKY